MLDWMKSLGLMQGGRWAALLTLSLAASACSGEKEPAQSVDTDPTLPSDGDGDGIPASDDCDDTDASVYPGAPEACNGVDDDCDGDIDEDAANPVEFFEDADADGYFNPAVSVFACDAPAGFIAASEVDCDDTNPDINPAASEECNGVDDNCNDEVDEDIGGGAIWYADEDGDGYGDDLVSTDACDPPSNYVDVAGDCDDSDDTINPDADEVCDDVDNNCDGAVDEDAVDAVAWFPDTDSDGYGDEAGEIRACAAPEGFVGIDRDCDDTNPDINPGAAEVCNDIDDDCDGTPDQDLATSMWYADVDMDGHGDASVSVEDCAAPSGYVALSDDCDDSRSEISPDAIETCDSEDNDCDGVVDESDAADAATWYADTDTDGYGDPASAVTACTVPSGYTADNTDCDDTRAAVFPGATETCNTLDDDCDGFTDEDDASDASTFYADTDSDGFGDPASTTRACSVPSGYTADDTDCDDTRAAVNPGATESCNSLDDDCDGSTDEDDASDAGTWYADVDVDGYGDATMSTRACSVPSGYVADNTDCDDGASAVNPGATEACNGIDDNCDSVIDEDGATGSTDYYADLDSDGYGDPGDMVASCSVPSGYVTDSSDCDDTRFAVNPAATEICDDGLDNDCDGGPNTCALDGDYDSTDADGEYFGPAGAKAGFAVAIGGDVDGDGISDLLVGAYAYDNADVDDGGVYLVSGPLSAVDNLATASTALLVGQNRGDQAGFSVDFAGDVDGDGYDDIIVGANGYEVSTVTRNEGATYLVTGPVTGTVALATADAQFVGNALTDFAGWSVSQLGDIDADGTIEYLVGAYKNDGAGADAGAAYILSAALTGSLTPTDATAVLRGESAGDEFAYSMAGNGDVDGDGNPDFIVGARYNDVGAADAGAAYLFSGSMSGVLSASSATARFLGNTASQQLGFDVSIAGDINNDGYDDIVLGSPALASSAGGAYVFYGPASGDLSVSVADASLTGEVAADQAGRTVASESDLNGDGNADLLIGAYSHDRLATNAGVTYLLHGPLSGAIALSTADARFDGDAASQTSGSALAAGADVTGDGIDDAIIGVPGDDTTGTDGGTVWVWGGFGW